MLEIIVSNTLNSAAQAVIDKLGEYDSEGVSHVVIVPDRFTMSVETEIFSRLKRCGAFNIEVVSFTRFAVKKLKNKCRKALTKEGAVVLLNEVAKNISEELEYFSEPDKKRGLMRDLYAVIASIRTSGIGAEELFTAFSEGKDRISRKYRDIARLYKAYDERVRADYSDTVTRLQLFLTELPNMPEIANTRVYVLGFNVFTAVELSVLRALEQSAKSLTVGLFEGFPGASHGLSNARTVSRVLSINPTAKIVRTEKETDAATAEIVRHTYGYENVSVTAADRFVPFFENTPYDEANAVAKQILAHIDEGKRFKDIAVVFCDDSYKSILKDVFARYGIPVFIDEKYPLANTVLARLLCSGLEAAATAAERAAFLAFAKNPLLGIPFSQVEELENFILKNNLNYSRLLTPFDSRLKDYTDETEAVRKTVADKLPKIGKTDTAKGYSAAISEFLSAFDGEEGAVLFGEKSVCRDAVLEELNAQSLERILEETNEIAAIIGDRTMDCKELLEVVSSAIDSVDISLIPDAVDAVFAGSSDDSPFFDKKIMFIVGAAAGRFPKESGWQAILTERDAAAVFAKGFELYPTPVDKLKSDKLAVLDLLTKADEKIYIGCPSYSLDGVRQTPCEALRQIAKATDNQTSRLSDRFSASLKGSAAVKGLGNIKNAVYELLKAEASGVSPETAPFYAALRKRLEATGEIAPRGGRKEEVSDIRLFERAADGRATTSVSRVETYMSCPYKYFLRYGLKVAPRDEGEMRIPDLGSVLHRILELVFKRLKGHFRVATDAELSEITAKAADETFADINYTPPAAVENNPVLFGNLRREADDTVKRLVGYVRQSRYEPTYFEVRFGDGARSVTVETSEGTVGISGKIDRVDALGEKIVVMDYKTGNTKGIADIKNLYFGKHIQLYVYPAAFRTDGKTIVGAYYVPVSGDYRSEGAAGRRFEGKTSELWSDVVEIDKTLDPYAKTSSEFLPVDLAVKGGKTVYKKTENMLGAEDFAFLENYALKTVSRAADAMADGFIAKVPLKDECQYCEFKSVCGEVPERKMTSVKLAEGGFSVETEEDGDE